MCNPILEQEETAWIDAFVPLLDTGRAGSSSSISEDYSLCKKIKANMLEVYWKLHDEREVQRFYVGGALSVDMWAAEQILRLKEQPGYEDIELVVALPFVGHDAKWDQRSKRRMEFILQHCSKKEVIGNEDCRESYVKRNCYMVDQANYLVAVYDDVRNLRSGTMQCVRYARKNDVPVVLIHPDTANITYPMESIKSAGCDLTNNNISWKKR